MVAEWQNKHYNQGVFLRSMALSGPALDALYLDEPSGRSSARAEFITVSFVFSTSRLGQLQTLASLGGLTKPMIHLDPFCYGRRPLRH